MGARFNMKYDVLVAGAGLAGSTAARLCAEQGRRVLVVERLNHIAGHCYDFKNKYGLTIHKYGPHIFHTNDIAVWEFVKRFTIFRPYEHRVLSFVDGLLLPFPINRDTIAGLFQMDIDAGGVKDLLRAEVAKARFHLPPLNFRDQVVSQVGEKLYEAFYKNYTVKQWQKDPEKLGAEIAARIPVRKNTDDRYFTDTYQGIPKAGYTVLVAGLLDHPNIDVKLATDFFKINKKITRGLTIYTGRLDRYFAYKYGTLEYRSLHLVFKTYKKEFFQAAAVVNYPNEHKWTRITEFKHFSGESSQHTTVCFEYPKAKGEPYYVVINQENNEKRERYLQEVKSLETQGACLFIGRLAEYKYYNMDQVIAAAMKKMAAYNIL
jgi:UDP-galactopyranose mutase